MKTRHVLLSMLTIKTLTITPFPARDWTMLWCLLYAVGIYYVYKSLLWTPDKCLSSILKMLLYFSHKSFLFLSVTSVGKFIRFEYTISIIIIPGSICTMHFTTHKIVQNITKASFKSHTPRYQKATYYVQVAILKYHHKGPG